MVSRAAFVMAQVAVCVLSMIASASALASSPEWWVAGSLLKGSEALAEKTSVVKPVVLKDKTFTIECSTVKVKGGTIEELGKGKVGSLVFTGCKDAVLGCSVAGEAIETKSLLTLLEGTTGSIRLLFEPAVGEELASFKLEGTTCKSTQKVTGFMKCDYPNVEKESKEHTLEFEDESLEAGGEEETPEFATFVTTFDWWLASGKTFSAQ